MIQETITYLILIGAVSAAVYRFVKVIAGLRNKPRPAAKRECGCSGCTSECSLRR